MSCKSCGNTSCGGNCDKKCIKVYRPTTWIDGQTGIQGPAGEDGVGIVNIVDNGNGSFTIFLSDATDYTIVLPPFTGKYLVDINFVVGNDNQWELVYDDASTLIIDSPYYIVNVGAGEEIITNQAGHPTEARSLNEFSINNKIVVDTVGDEIQFNVKQYGKPLAVNYKDNTGALNYLTMQSPKYQNISGSVAVVSNSGGPVVTNLLTKNYEIAFTPIDAFHGHLYFRIVQTFDITYNDLSWQAAKDKKFHFHMGFQLIDNQPEIPLNYWDQLNINYWDQSHTQVMYDIYMTGQPAGEDTTNKLRRYAEHRVCDVMSQPNNGTTTDPGSGWYGSGAVGPRLFFRYPYVDLTLAPQAQGDVIQSLEFEAIGTIVLGTNTNTDVLSTLNLNKNH